MRRRGWTIRTKTTVAFALASMASTTAVLVLVTLASLWTWSSVSVALRRAEVPPAAGAGAPGAPAPPAATPMVVPDQGDLGDAQVDSVLLATAAPLQWGWAALGVLVSGVLAGGVGWLVAHRVLRPIDRITETTRCLSASTLHERIGLDGPDDELRRLSRTIDDLLERLEAAFESQRRFVAQASHELRTPLAVQRTALQVGLAEGGPPKDVRAVRDELLEQNRRTEHLVESLLVLAEADRGLDGRTEPVALGALVRQVTEAVRSQAAAAQVLVEVDDHLGDGSVVVAEGVLLRQTIGNLVDNAVEYNRPGGCVHVAVLADRLTIANDGPRVEDPVALLEPFRRGAAPGARQHSGLGLSIVAAIARAHGWRLDVRARDTGGLVVVVSFGVLDAGVSAA